MHEVKIQGETLSGILLLPFAVDEKPKKENQPIFRRAEMRPSSLDLVAQLPRAQKVAFLHVWTTESSLMTIRNKVSLEEFLPSVTHVK